ncbi:hypothetical protein C8Q74DRAFT_366423 [Fomes fomentarius]|nr:hypothetical protein C8Q74DRAFT_366423 [Fomes fomentarius]
MLHRIVSVHVMFSVLLSGGNCLIRVSLRDEVSFPTMPPFPNPNPRQSHFSVLAFLLLAPNCPCPSCVVISVVSTASRLLLLINTCSCALASVGHTSFAP